MMGKGMGGSKVEGKMGLVVREREEEADEDEEFGLDDDNDGEEDEDEDEEKKKRGKRMMGAGEYRKGTTSNLVFCQADNCGTDLRDAKKYHKRHKVCEVHSKAPVVLVSGLQQRFCQQCSRFHGLSEFDDSKRSCRRRLAGHNQRRRKNSSEYYGDGSN